MAWKSMDMCRIEVLLAHGAISDAFRVVKLLDQKKYVLKKTNLKLIDGTLGNREVEEKLKNLHLEEGARAVALNHENIVRCFGFFIENDCYHQVVEFCDSCLERELRPRRITKYNFPEEQIYSWARQIASAIYYLHQSGISHSEIQPKNVLLAGESKQVRLTGFFLSVDSDSFIINAVKNSRCKILESVGGYFPPELLNDKNASPSLSASDVWAFGALLYELVTLERLFTVDSAEHYMSSIQNFQSLKKLKKKELSAIKADVVEFLDFVVVPESEKRPTMGAILRHSYLGDLPRLFISYSWRNKERVLTLKRKLDKWGFIVWIDDESMHGNITDAMAEGIENANVALICYSEDYSMSRNCKLEAEYIVQLGKAFVPIKMQADYNPRGWLSIIIGNKLYYDVSDDAKFDETASRLVGELKHIGRFPKGDISRNETRMPISSAKNNLADGSIKPSNISQGEEEFITSF